MEVIANKVYLCPPLIWVRTESLLMNRAISIDIGTDMWFLRTRLQARCDRVKRDFSIVSHGRRSSEWSTIKMWRGIYSKPPKQSWSVCLLHINMLFSAVRFFFLVWLKFRVLPRFCGAYPCNGRRWHTWIATTSHSAVTREEYDNILSLISHTTVSSTYSSNLMIFHVDLGLCRVMLTGILLNGFFAIMTPLVGESRSTCGSPWVSCSFSTHFIPHSAYSNLVNILQTWTVRKSLNSGSRASPCSGPEHLRKRAKHQKLPLTALFTQQTSIFGFVCSTKLGAKDWWYVRPILKVISSQAIQEHKVGLSDKWVIQQIFQHGRDAVK